MQQQSKPNKTNHCQTCMADPEDPEAKEPEDAEEALTLDPVLSEPDEDIEEPRLLPEEPEELAEESHAVQDEVVVVGAAVTFAGLVVVLFVAFVLTSEKMSIFAFALGGGGAPAEASSHLPPLQVQSPLHIVICPALGSVVSHSAQEGALC
jgi:hypothetical protein